MSKKAGITRGCGRRRKGAIYAEVPMSPIGRPLEDFLVCKPVPVDAQALGLSSVGVKLLADPKQAALHIWDVVGQEHYPNVADFVEEARRFGISRRLPKTLDFRAITKHSKLILLHQRAHMECSELWHKDRQRVMGKLPYCPKGVLEHLDAAYIGMCAGLWWEDVEGGNDDPRGDEVNGMPMEGHRWTDSRGRAVVRKMPSTEYLGYKPPEGVSKLWYHLAIFGAFPLGRLVVIKDDDAGTHEQAYENAQKDGIPVELEDE